MNRDDVIDALGDLGEPPYLPPSWDDVNDADGVTTHYIHTNFDRLDDALAEAGYDLDNAIRGHHIPRDELIFDLRIGAAALGRSPSVEEYKRYGEYAFTTQTSRFDGWAGALEAAGLPPTGDPVEFDVADVDVPEVSLLYNDLTETHSRTDDEDTPTVNA